MKFAAYFAIAILLSGCASQQGRTYLGHQVIDMPFVIAGGEILHLPITDAGPVPAEGNGFKVEVAGFSVGPDSKKENTAELIWGFAISTVSSSAVKHLTIEEVSPSDVTTTWVSEANPEFEDGTWRDNLPPIEVNEKGTPFLYDNSASIYVFKVTIEMESEPPIVLYQPAWFSSESKSVYQQLITRIESG